MGEVQSGEESGLAIGEPAANVRQAFGLEGDRLMKCVVLRNVLADASLGLSPSPAALTRFTNMRRPADSLASVSELLFDFVQKLWLIGSELNN
jgi:hypothetical protein